MELDYVELEFVDLLLEFNTLEYHVRYTSQFPHQSHSQQ